MMSPTMVLIVLLVVAMAMPAVGVEPSFFSQGTNGWFRLQVTSAELAGFSPTEVAPEACDEHLFQVAAGSTRMDFLSLKSHLRVCRANMRVLLGASEMYAMDNEKPFTGSDQEFQEILVEKQYLRQPVVPPSARCRYSLPGDGHGGRTVICAEHGGMESDEIEQERQLRERGQTLAEKPGLMIFGRFRGSGQTRLRLHDRRSGRLLLEVAFELPKAASSADNTLRQDWQSAWQERMLMLGRQTPADSLFPYLRNQVPRRLNLTPKPEASRRDSRFGAPQQADLYSLTTGALAIQEALQLDRMTGSAVNREEPKEAIDGLKGPEIKSHDYAEMIGSRQPQTLGLDQLVPAGFYSCHFSDINRQIAFGDLLDQWGTSLLHTLQAAAHDARVKEKLLEQLCLETSELTRLFGDKVIADLTVCGADPFLHEGTDCSVLFTVKSPTLFDLMASKRFSAAKGRHPDAREEQLSIDGTTVHALTTPDGVLRSYSCDFDGIRIFSNSPAALERILATGKKRHPSLAEALDYRYMRTIFPPDPAQEDLFLYLSDAHIRQLVGPEWKIARQRRLQCVNSLRILHHAVTLYKDENPGKVPTLPALLADRCLEKDYLFCPDGGTYTLEGTGCEPACSCHGHLRYLRPILETRPRQITKTERREYELFVENYKQFWRRFFDPVGIRGRLATEDIRLETCILPLVENSVYDGFRMVCGGEPIDLDLPFHPKTIARLAGKLDTGNLGTFTSSWGRAIQDLVSVSSLTIEELLAALGPGFLIGLADGDLRFEFVQDTTGFLLPDLARDPVRAIIGGTLLYALNLPVYAVIQVRQAPIVERFLRESLDQLMRRSLANNNRFQSWLRFQIYETPSGKSGAEIWTLDFQLVLVRFRFFFAVHQGALVISTQRGVLEAMLGPDVPRLKTRTNLDFRLRYEAFDRISETTRINWQEREREACLNNLGSLWALSRLRGVPAERWAEEALRVNGFVPFCPEGGTYRDDGDSGAVRCSLHGHPEAPRQPHDADPSQPINRFLDSLTELGASLQFTPEGIHTTTNIRRKKP